MPQTSFSATALRRSCTSALVVVLALITGACGSSPTVPAAAAPSADAWAVVDGREIRRDEVEKAYRRTAPPNQTPPDEEVWAAKLNLLNELIVQDILLAKARELKVELPDTELDKAWADSRKDITESDFQQELTRRNLTAMDMREGLRRELLIQKLMERELGPKVAVSEQDVIDFFNANRASFNLAEDSYRIAQIVVTPVRDPDLANRTGDDAATPEAATRKTQMLMERLKGGASFGELAADYSEDPESAPRGGDLGLVPLSRLNQAPPALRDAVLKKEPGTVNVVSAGGGHTIVLMVGREAAGQRDLNTPGLRDNISGTLRGRKEQLLRAAYLTAARSDATVVNLLARNLLETQGKMPSLAPRAPGTP